MPADPIRDALAELVALKRLKEAIRCHNPHTDSYTAHVERKDEYERRKGPAWEAARRALAQGADTPSVPVARQWSLDSEAAGLLGATIGLDDSAPITLAEMRSPDGYGLHVWLTEYPEEGSILLVAAVGSAATADAEVKP